MKPNNTKKLVISAMLLALGYILPFLTGQIKEIGNMLLPMHIPVMLAGLLLGARYGAAIGFILPITRSLIFTMPAMYPNAVAMAFELAAYGLVAGIMMSMLRRFGGIVPIYVSLVTSMLAGRAVWGGAMTLLVRQTESAFTVSAFLAGAFVNAVPGIIIQLVIIPPIVYACHKVFGKTIE